MELSLYRKEIEVWHSRQCLCSYCGGMGKFTFIVHVFNLWWFLSIL